MSQSKSRKTVAVQRSGSASLFQAAKDADWMQVVLNQGPPCFHLEDGRFCLRADRWDGHKTIGGSGPIHNFISLESLLRSADERSPGAVSDTAEAFRRIKTSILASEKAKTLDDDSLAEALIVKVWSYMEIGTQEEALVCEAIERLRKAVDPFTRSKTPNDQIRRVADNPRLRKL